MIMYKAYKFRLYPNDNQKVLINKSFGVKRYIYNYFLEKANSYYKKNKLYMSKQTMIKELPSLGKELPWLLEVDSLISRNAIDDLDKSFNNYFKKRSNYPRFKSKFVKDSYKTTCIRNTYKDKSYTNIKLEKGYITLPNLGKVIIRGYRNLNIFAGKIINATISRDGYKYYVSVVMQEDTDIPKFKLNYIVGIDVGVKAKVTCSDGIVYKMNSTEKVEKRIKLLQQKLSRCKKESKNSIKLKMKIQRMYQKLKNTRKYNNDKIAKELVRDNDIIVCEDLSVNNMLASSKHDLARRIANATFSKLISTLEYKCKISGKKLMKVNKYFPSSQMCNTCGYINKEVKDLAIRNWTCKKCGFNHERDYNASINIMEEGIRLYYKEILV